MYNESLKREFMLSPQASSLQEDIIVRVFEEAEPFEAEWGADLCTQEPDELRKIIWNSPVLRAFTIPMQVSVLNAYTRWCIQHNVPGTKAGIFLLRNEWRSNPSEEDLKKIRMNMIPNPKSLQQYLDLVFAPEHKETVDVTYRCYYWLAYGGVVNPRDIMQIKTDDVHLREMYVSYKDTSIPIYPEAVPAFQYAIELSSFVYDNPRSGKEIRRDRVAGTELMRGLKTVPTPEDAASRLARRNKKLADSGVTDLRLVIRNIITSGAFYRMMLSEINGFPVDFFELARDMIVESPRKKEGVSIGKYSIQQRAVALKSDYERWKKAFGIQINTQNL